MFQELGFQLYTIRDFIKDPEFADLALAKVAKAGYSQIHTACVDEKDTEFIDLVHKNGMSIVGTHYSFTKILEAPEQTMELHRAWGTTNVGIGAMPSDARKSLEGLKTFIDKFNKAAELYAKQGFKLTYHNHNFEFVRIDGKKTIMDLLYEGLDPATTSFVLDTCWVAAGGGDVTDWMEKLAGRIDILHLKDTYLEKDEVKGLTHVITEVGNGSVAWDKVMDTAEKIGVKYYVVEQDKNWSPTPFDSLKMSADFLAKYRK